MGIASASETAARPLARAAFRYLPRATYWLAVAAAAVVLGAVLASVGARLFGYSPYVMYGGSMGSEAPLGSIAFIENVPAESLNVGDVIIFRPPSSGEAREPVMHRIIAMEEVDGQRVVRTKGDANGSADPWEIGLSGEGGRLVFFVPYVGYLLWFFQTRLAWAIIVLPLAVYTGFVALRGIWAPAGGRDSPTTPQAPRRRKRPGAGTPEPPRRQRAPAAKAPRRAIEPGVNAPQPRRRRDAATTRAP